jgi:hypothetical protein
MMARHQRKKGNVVVLLLLSTALAVFLGQKKTTVRVFLVLENFQKRSSHMMEAF